MVNTLGYWFSLHGLATFTLIGAALYFLLVEHGPHTLPYLPYLIILLCPLMHLFMHKGHSGHNHGDDKYQEADEAYHCGGGRGTKTIH